jgi:hypothetical protein
MSLKQIAIAALGKDSVTSITCAESMLIIHEGANSVVVEQEGKEYAVFLKGGKIKHKTATKAIIALGFTATPAAAKGKSKQPAKPETAGDTSTTEQQ